MSTPPSSGPTKVRIFAHPSRPSSAAAGGSNQFGFRAATGTNYTQGDEPQIAADLGRMGQALHRLFVGLSGYRTPAHSVAVGGFADDPHTRGQASDTQGVESIPESTLEKYGLTRPFAGAKEADHVQLLGGNTSSTKGTVMPRNRNTGTNGPASWLKQAGWPSNLIPIMVAIGGAESRWRINAVSPPNTNGTVDRGWLQINSVHSQFDPGRLTSDPVYTARAALAVYKEQGLGAWSTYNNGAYKAFMGESPTPEPGKVRPGGESDDGSGASGGNEYVSLWSTIGKLNPLKILGAAGQGINSAADFFKWIAWIFHPLNILRVVEFLVGFPLLIMGVWTMIQVWRDASDETPVAIAGRQAKAAAGVFSPASKGKGIKAAKSSAAGGTAAKSAAKSAPRAAATTAMDVA